MLGAERPREPGGRCGRVGASGDEHHPSRALGDQTALPNDAGKHRERAGVRHALDSRNRYTAAPVLMFLRGLITSLAVIALPALATAAPAGACAGEAKSPAKLNEQLARQAVLCLINE